MVMKNVMRKNLLQSVRRSITRYIAIVGIIALGAGIFVGLRTTKRDMIATGQKFMDEQKMFDLQLMSTYGWSDAQLEAVGKLPGVELAEGVISLDVLACLGDGDKANVYKLIALPQAVNQVKLLGGRMPQNESECLLDGYHMDDSVLGLQVTVSPQNEKATLESLAAHTYTVVGYVSTPLYMDMSRGSTTLGNGSVAGYLYLPRQSFDVDYYTQIDITIAGDLAVYTPEYDQAVENATDRLQPLLEQLAMDRYQQVKLDAKQEFQDGLAEYADGFREFREGKAQALKELNQAEAELQDGEKTIAENLELLADGQRQLQDGEKTLAEGKQQLLDGEQELNRQERDGLKQIEDARLELLENHKTVSENLALVTDGIVQLDDGLTQLNDGIGQLESGLQQLETTLTLLKTLDATADAAIAGAQSALDQAQAMGMPAEVVDPIRAQLQQLNQQRLEYTAQIQELENQKAQYGAQLAQLKQQRQELEATRQELLSNKAMLEDALTQINDGFTQLEQKKAEAQEQIAEAREEIRKGKNQIAAGEKELAQKKQELSDAQKELSDAQKTLEEGWQEFRSAKAEALQELSDAENELMDARQQLQEAEYTIRSMAEPDLFILNRNANAGYLALDSSSDIVQGVSTVFPAFFLLIAALVCITTMTRMVEEERTEIGTLKALGYTNWEIVSKYLVYAGSAAIIGCGLGVIIGSVIFPIILWEAYGILLNIMPNIVLEVDWLLCGVVVLAYTAVNLLVTWYCCRRILTHVPAELIRPKAPTSGKKIFLEYLPFWNRFSFLNKVMLRNIFRYTQRLLMMLIGIGGCTALLLTGFGIRDSIMDVVDYQFQEITLYDMDVRFHGGQTQEEMEAFCQEVSPYSQQVYFFYQSSVEVGFDGVYRDITLIAADQGLSGYMDLHYHGESVPMPGPGEAVISVGAAQIMDVSIGDSVTLRNSDMQPMTVTVSGIYENYVNNYIIITPQTYAQGWGEEPAMQVACLNVSQGQDVHLAGTQITQADGVMSVMICQDLADQVGTMLEALNLVVATIVVCAGALAVIVLYNLTNINITERIREIATIKVLGFRAGESAAYVFKENLLLSVMGAALGLVGGRFLLIFVMSQIKVDMVWLQSRLNPESYVLAIVLTMLCAVLVDFVLYFRLDKINMAEALKSVE